ncbi:MAG: putative holin-like toxin [Treponema sp.]|nr:putative holin-like toxin [Treponema sp.]
MGGCKMTVFEILSLVINVAILILTLLSYLKK